MLQKFKICPLNCDASYYSCSVNVSFNPAYFLLSSTGKFDPQAMNNFYDNIQPGPVVPPKPGKKGEDCLKQFSAHRSETFPSGWIRAKWIFHRVGSWITRHRFWLQCENFQVLINFIFFFDFKHFEDVRHFCLKTKTNCLTNFSLSASGNVSSWKLDEKSNYLVNAHVYQHLYLTGWCLIVSVEWQQSLFAALSWWHLNCCVIHFITWINIVVHVMFPCISQKGTRAPSQCRDPRGMKTLKAPSGTVKAAPSSTTLHSIAVNSARCRATPELNATLHWPHLPYSLPVLG